MAKTPASTDSTSNPGSSSTVDNLPTNEFGGASHDDDGFPLRGDDFDTANAADNPNPYAHIAEQNRAATDIIKAPKRLTFRDLPSAEHAFALFEGMIRHLAGDEYVDAAIMRHGKAAKDAERNKPNPATDTRANA